MIGLKVFARKWSVKKDGLPNFLLKLSRGSFIQYLRKIFRRTSISDPLRRTRTKVYKGVRNVIFRKNLHAYQMDKQMIHRPTTFLKKDSIANVLLFSLKFFRTAIIYSTCKQPLLLFFFLKRISASDLYNTSRKIDSFEKRELNKRKIYMRSQS